MKVLYPLRYYPTLSETFIYREIDGVMAAGVEVTIAALGQREDGELQDERPAAPVLRVPRHSLVGSLGRPTRGQAWLARAQREKDARRLPWLGREVRRLGIDRVHAHFGGEAAEWAHALWLDLGLPYTVMVHAVDLFKPRPMLAEVLSHAGAVLTVADHHIPTLRALGVEPRRVRCGPDLHRWRPSPLPEGPLRALFVGRNVPKKGLSTLLQAWEGLDRPAASLTVISDSSGPLPAGVTCTGLLPPSRVKACLAASNLLVSPCRRAADGDLDGVPVVLMEAMALGRPVLSTAISGIPELVDEAVGWLVPPDDALVLRAALREIADDPRARGERGRAGPGRLRERAFTLTDQVNGLLASWDRASR